MTCPKGQYSANSHCNKPLLRGQSHGFGAVASPQLAHQGADVKLGGALANVEDCGDFLVLQPLGQKFARKVATAGVISSSRRTRWALACCRTLARASWAMR